MQNRFNRVGAGLLCAALLGLAPGAASEAIAVDCCEWELRVRRTAVLSDTFRVELYAHFPDVGVGFAGANFDILGNGIEWNSVDVCLPFPLPGATPGTIAGDDVVGISLGQTPLVGTDPSNPLLVWCGEFRCDGAGFGSVSTATGRYEYFTDSSGSRASCAPIESHRSVFCGPIVIDPGWLATALPGTKLEPRGSQLELLPVSAGGRFGASVGDERIDWRDPEASFGVQLDIGSLRPGASIDFEWFPWLDCWPFIGGFRVRTIMGDRDVLEIVPDFSETGLVVIPILLYRDGEVVGKDEIKSGASLGLQQFCGDLWWSWETDQFDRPVLVLSGGRPLLVVPPGGRATEVDKIVLADLAAPGSMVGMERVELVAEKVERLTVLGAGAIDRGCYADCDESGQLDFFDFLCFQDAFAAGERYADCDESGGLDFFDFLCFQNAFAAACP